MYLDLTIKLKTKEEENMWEKNLPSDISLSANVSE